MPNYLTKALIVSLLVWVCMALTPTALPIRATISEESFAIGFSDTLKSAGKPFWFEASAILFDGKSLLVAHDKPMPDGRSSVGRWPGLHDATLQPPAYFTGDVFKKGIKYEEMTQSPDRKWTFLMNSRPTSEKRPFNVRRLSLDHLVAIGLASDLRRLQSTACTS